MKIEIKGLGPIKEEADIELGDLTVFFGPPNSGKSTVLKALYYSLNLPELDFIRKSEKTLTNYILDINYEIEQNVLRFSFSPS